MNPDLMMDTLNALIDRSQTQIEQIVRKNKSITSKLRYITLNLAQLKFQILDWVISVVNNIGLNKQIEKKLQLMKNKTLDQLSKCRLHALLKQKLQKLKKQSFLNSMLSNQNNLLNQTSTDLTRLQQSILLMERDMNIQEDEEFDLGISAIIKRSRMNLLEDNALNMSAISQCEAYVSGEKQQNSFGLERAAQIKLDKQTSQQQYQLRKERNDIDKIQESQKIQQIKQVGQNENKGIVQKVMKKKKKSVYTSIGNSQMISRQDLLGNLLQETYQQHFSESQTQ